jgi:hypothetical protein
MRQAYCRLSSLRNFADEIRLTASVLAHQAAADWTVYGTTGRPRCSFITEFFTATKNFRGATICTM